MTKDEQILFTRVALTAVRLLKAQGVAEPTVDEVKAVIPDAIAQVRAFDEEMALCTTVRAKMARVALLKSVWMNIHERETVPDLVKRCEFIEAQPHWPKYR